MGYCSIHGSYGGSEGCWDCQKTEENLQRAMEAQQEAQERAAEANEERLLELQSYMSDLSKRQSDPGDYVCPHCLYRTLRRDATRCPFCHAHPGPEYWPNVHKKEKKEIAELEARRANEAEQATRRAAVANLEAKEAALTAAKLRSERQSKEIAGRAAFTRIGAIGGAIMGGVSALVLLSMPSSMTGLYWLKNSWYLQDGGIYGRISGSIVPIILLGIFLGAVVGALYLRQAYSIDRPPSWVAYLLACLCLLYVIGAIVVIF